MRSRLSFQKQPVQFVAAAIGFAMMCMVVTAAAVMVFIAIFVMPFHGVYEPVLGAFLALVLVFMLWATSRWTDR